MIAGGYRNVYMPPLCVWEWLRLSVLREVHVLRAGERLQRPVDEAVKEDEAGAGSPNRQDGDEGGTQIIDHLQAPKQTQHNRESISHSVWVNVGAF